MDIFIDYGIPVGLLKAVYKDIWIRDRHLVEIVIIRLTCVLYAFPFNILPFIDSQTRPTFGSEIACSDVTKTLIAPTFSVRYFLNFVRRWSIQFVTAIQRTLRQTGAITRRKKCGRLTPPPPPPASRGLSFTTLPTGGFHVLSFPRSRDFRLCPIFGNTPTSPM